MNDSHYLNQQCHWIMSLVSEKIGASQNRLYEYFIQKEKQSIYQREGSTFINRKRLTQFGLWFLQFNLKDMFCDKQVSSIFLSLTLFFWNSDIAFYSIKCQLYLLEQFTGIIKLDMI